MGQENYKVSEKDKYKEDAFISILEVHNQFITHHGCLKEWGGLVIDYWRKLVGLEQKRKATLGLVFDQFLKNRASPNSSNEERNSYPKSLSNLN